MKKNALYIWVCLLFCLVSCQDEEIINNGFDPSLKGKKEVAFTMQFEPMFPALDSRTAGDAIKHINDLNILIYEANDVSKPVYHLYSSNEDRNDFTFTTEDSDTPSFDGELGAGQAESKTCRATFKYTLPYGQYKIIAVANYKKKIAIADVIDTNNDNCLSEDEIRSIKLSWDTKDIAENNQMFGFFRTDKRYKDVIGPTGVTETVTISPKTTELHAWLKRAASKVTVAYDATYLNDNVYIYLKSVQIKDIPKTCYLGKDNTPPYDDEEKKPAYVLDADGEIIYYKGADKNDDGKTAYTNWPHVSRGQKYYYYTTETGNPESLEGAHTEKMNALFFYENMQGTGKSKLQDANDDGSLDFPGLPDDETYRKKDGMEYGTYIEVKAFYVNENAGANTSGDITYRFMLGKDADTDYNAERNYHYKLTLCFNGDANDVDWHIEYEEEPGVKLPDPGFISYLYNEEMKMPIRVVPGEGQEVGSIKVEIMSNPWWPNVENNGIYYDVDLDKSLWNGFLSLGKLNQAIVDPANPSFSQSDLGTNENVWENYELGERIYNVESGTHMYDPNPNDKVAAKDLGGEATYEIEKEQNGDVKFTIPFYTVAKTMTSYTAYSGTNIYFTGERVAEVQVTAYTGKDGAGEQIGETRTIPIKQVKRLENPNGIWRRYNNSEAFDVTLYEQEGVMDGNSIEFRSHGPWRVYVESATNENEASDASWILLNNQSSTIGKVMVEGATESLIQFRYQPNGKIGKNQVRCGVIVVEYNNYSCRHRIFVRQGYAPLQMVNGGVKWRSFNRYSWDDDAASPLEEGSMFKFGMRSNAIDESNNWRNGFGFNDDPGTKKYKMVDKDYMTWAQMNTDNNGFDDIENGARVASTEDWLTLRSEMDYAFGILYDDNSATVQTSFSNATQYRRGVNDKKRGMRGCFVYDKKTGKQLFFPIGATGYGRRKNNVNGDSHGTLKYAQMSDETIKNEKRPMLWDLYLSKGAIYWCNKVKKDVSPNSDGITINTAWDINYRTFEFNLFYSYANNSNGYSPKYTNEMVEGQSDACFVRVVEE